MRWSLVLDDEREAAPKRFAVGDPEPEEGCPEGQVWDPAIGECVDEEAQASTAGRFHAVLIVEDTWSGDGRFIRQDSLSWRDLPLPLMGLDTTTEMHQEAVVVGHIDKIERQGNELHGWGVWATDPEAMAIREHVRANDLRGVSADLDDVEFELLFPEPEEGEEPGLILLTADAGDRGDGDLDDAEVITLEDPKLRVTKGRIMGATIVPFPAFAECFIEDLDPEAALVAGAVASHSTGISDGPWDGAAEEGKLTQPMAIGTARAMYGWIEDGVDEADVPKTAAKFPHHEVGDNGAPGVANVHALAAVVAALNGGRGGADIPADDRQGIYDHVAKHYADNDLEAPELASVAGITAAGPVAPPRAWFDDPGLAGSTPLTIHDNGRVVGHIATWDTCHISFPDRCVPPPHSASNYAHFLHGEVRCSDGTRVSVGQLCLKGGHAPVELSPAAAMAHYDDTRSCVADLACGEDRHGIWVAGALRPNVSPADVRSAMASGVSGDWRRIGGVYELINLSSVNSPGFPVRGTRMYETAGLIASVIATLPPVHEDDGLVASTVERIARSIGRGTDQRIDALYRRVHA